MITTYAGYPIYEEEDGTLLLDGAPCGCPACDDGTQPGHFACSSSPEGLLLDEEQGMTFRFYNGTSWVWAVTQRGIESARWLIEDAATEIDAAIDAAGGSVQ